ncbi:hypothetical protein JCM10450v2_002177 [Rhodotorula kratochvilovae]
MSSPFPHASLYGGFAHPLPSPENSDDDDSSDSDADGRAEWACADAQTPDEEADDEVGESGAWEALQALRGGPWSTDFLPPPARSPPAPPRSRPSRDSSPLTDLEEQEEEDEDMETPTSSTRSPSLELLIPGSASTSTPRRTVLFYSTATFDTKDAFFEACRTTLLAAYDVRTHIYVNVPMRLASRCCLGQTAYRCPFRVWVDKTDDGWVLAPDKCIWEHSHDRATPSKRAYTVLDDSSDEEDLPAPSRTTRSTRTDRLGAEAAESEQGDARPARRTATRKDPLPYLPADFPRPHTTYYAVKDAYRAFLRLVIPKTGISLSRVERPASARLFCNAKGCKFSISLAKDPVGTLWRIDYIASRLEHSHPPHPKLVRDPNWRPFVHSKDARAALKLYARDRGRNKWARVEDDTDEEDEEDEALEEQTQAQEEDEEEERKVPTTASRILHPPPASCASASDVSFVFAAGAIDAAGEGKARVPNQDKGKGREDERSVRSTGNSIGFSTAASLAALLLFELITVDVALELVLKRAEGEGARASRVQLGMLGRLIKGAGERVRESG